MYWTLEILKRRVTRQPKSQLNSRLESAHHFILEILSLLMAALKTFARCWMAYILLVWTPITYARPRIPNEPMMMRFCGRDLINAIDETCVTFKSPAVLIDPLALNRTSLLNDESVDSELLSQPTKLDDKKSDALLRQCCLIGCTEDDLATFCHSDRNQIIGAAMHLRNQEWDNDWLYEFLPRYEAILTSD